jgi:hypothetical protein
MSEQNPYGAPVGSPAAVPAPWPPLPPAGLQPSTPFAPPAPAGVAQPVLPPPPPHAGLGQPMREDHPSMTLTELSFAPVATEPVAAPEPVLDEAPPPPSGLGTILPSGRGGGRSLSVGGGRTSLIAFALIALLAVAGVVFGTGLLKGDEPAPVPAQKKPVVAKPLAGKKVSVKAKTNTLGAGYTLTVPTGFKATVGKATAKGTMSVDIAAVDAKTRAVLAITSTATPRHADGAPAAKELKLVKAAIIDVKGTKVGPSSSVQVAGVTGTRFDLTEPGKTPLKARVVVFVKGGTMYTVGWVAPAKSFTKSVPTMSKVLATLKFAPSK